MLNDEHPHTEAFVEAMVNEAITRWLWTPNLTGEDIGIGLESKALKSSHLSPVEKVIREIIQNIIDRIRKGEKTVKCVIRIRELYGSDKEEFLAALGIDQLIPNLGASEEARFKRAAEEVLAKESILVLYVEDYHTEGLNGPEYAHLVVGPDGPRNFSALGRSSARSRQSNDHSGGQHGVGKSVQTTSSDIGTVVYYSNPDDSDRNRLFGVCTIDSHTVDGKPHTGKATFGVEATIQKKFVEHTRESVRGSDADLVADELGFKQRGPDDTGTSICIPVFDIPGSQVSDPVELADHFSSAIRKWFAPALAGATATKLEAYIQSPEDSEPVRVKMDEDDGEPTPFSKLVTEMPSWKDHIEKEFTKDGDIVSRSFRYKLPGGGNAEAVVMAMQVPEGSPNSRAQEGLTEVGIYRGPGMIIEFKEVKEQSLSETRYIALVATGMGIRRPGDSPGLRDKESDAFLASTEPPAHDYFDPRASKAGEKYGTGAVKRTLTQFNSELKKALRSISEIKPSDDEKTSDYLAKLTPFGRGGKKRKGKPRPGQIAVMSRSMRRGEDEWEAPTRVIAAFKPPRFTNWSGQVEVHVGSEASNKPNPKRPDGTSDRLDISNVSVVDGDGRNLIDLGTAEVLSAGGRSYAVKLSGVDAKEVSIRLRASRPTDMSLPGDYISPLVVSTLTKGGA